MIEVAPGIDIEREILAQMDFKPIIRRDPASWISAYSCPSRWDCATTCCACRSSSASPIIPRKTSSSSISKDTWFETTEDIERIRRIVETMLSSLGRKVHVIVNYDNFNIFPDVVDEYSAMVRELVDRFYSGATRYTTSGFLRTKLGDAFSRRAVAPHIYESADEASAHLSELKESAAADKARIPA